MKRMVREKGPRRMDFRDTDGSRRKSMNNTYEIKISERTYNAKGETGQDAIERLCKRRLPNGGTWWMYKGVRMYDAETHGTEWAQCKVERDESGNCEIATAIRKENR